MELLLMDHTNGVIIGQDMLTPLNDETQEIINMFISFIMQNGRMKKIIIRNPYIASILHDTCKYCKITISMKKQLPEVDMFINEFRSHR